MPLEIPFLHGSNDNNFSKYYIYQRLARNNLVYPYIYIYRGRIEIDRKRDGGYLRGLGPATRQRKILAARVGCIRQQKRRLTADRLSELFPCKLGEGPLGTPSALERRSPIRFILSRNVYWYTVVHLRVPFTWIRRKRIFSNAKY